MEKYILRCILVLIFELLEAAIAMNEIAFKKLIDEIEQNRCAKDLELNFWFWSAIEDPQCIRLAEALEKNSNVQILRLNGSWVGDEGAKALAKALKQNHSLQTLDLSNTNVGVAGVQALAEALKTNQGLQNLNLSYLNKDISTAAPALADALKTNETLQKLDLTRNYINEKAAKAFADALQVNKNLQALILSHNKINDAGANALAEALRENTNLCCLPLDNNECFGKYSLPVGTYNGYTFQEYEDRMENQYTHDQIIELLDRNKKMAPEREFEALIRNIKKNRYRELDLSNKNIDDKKAIQIAEALKENKSLHFLNLGNNNIIDGSNNISDVGAEALVSAMMENTNLQIPNLVLSRKAISKGTLDKLAKLLELNKSPDRIKKISLNEQFTHLRVLAQPPTETLQKIYRIIKKESYVREYENCKNVINNLLEDLGKIGIDITLKKQELDQLLRQCEKQTDTSELCKLFDMQTLGLNGSDIGDGATLLVAKALATNTKVQTLKLYDNQVGNAAAKAVIK